ncbi:DUF1295-domain-containing protein [Clavulina sp. PMI_390]|nr:DUF1295-domain-containing protein [Clavulina sp. PMI_390]
MTVFVLDHFYLLITLLITVGYQLSGFFIAWTLQFDKITDLTGGSNFFILALITLLFGDTYHARNIVASVLQMIWAVRIAGFLLFRVLKTGSDTRFDDIRSNFFMFLGFWVAQILWVWVVSLPVIILNSPAVSRAPGGNPAFGTAGDIIGIILWAIGWLIETISDAQKYRFKASKPPKDRVADIGLWNWSRHPPYFGEICCWWGIWALCLSPTMNGNLPHHAKSAQYGAIVSPLFTMIVLIFGSGLPPAEKPTAERYYLLTYGPESKPETARAWSNYVRYRNTTSILVPLPPSLYARLPQWIKIGLFELPMFHFDEEVEGPKAIEKAKAKASENA